MTVQDKLTRGERIRLEAFAQACNSAAVAGPRYDRPVTEPLAWLFERAEAIETWLLQAKDSQPLMKPGTVVHLDGRHPPADRG